MRQYALPDALDAFLVAACAPRDAAHVSGTLGPAEAILARWPDLSRASIHAAATLGDEAAARRLLAADPGSARAPGGPYGWDPLTHLCFSRYLRLDRSRSEAFVRTAEALLDAGADPNTGWLEEAHEPQPEWESAIYGAAGVAHHAGLTRLLLEWGADPNDEETPYHAPEGYDNEALYVLVDSGRLSAESLRTILLRKTDWHDGEAIRWLLVHGADPNAMSRWGKTPLHNAVLSDNSFRIVELLLDHGADPTLISTHPDRSPEPAPPRSAVQMAARRGRGDLLELFERRGFPSALEGVDALIAACARGDAAAVRVITGSQPSLAEELRAEGGVLLSEFAGVGNTDGVRLLLDLGVPVDAPYERGDGYFGIAPHSLALHVAAWRGWPETVKLLVGRGAPVDARDGAGHTPLQLAVRACVDSYWSERRSPEWVDALLRAGASVAGVPYPCGYAEADDLLRRYGATPAATPAASRADS